MYAIRSYYVTFAWHQRGKPHWDWHCKALAQRVRANEGRIRAHQLALSIHAEDNTPFQRYGIRELEEEEDIRVGEGYVDYDDEELMGDE